MGRNFLLNFVFLVSLSQRSFQMKIKRRADSMVVQFRLRAGETFHPTGHPTWHNSHFLPPKLKSCVHTVFSLVLRLKVSSPFEAKTFLISSSPALPGVLRKVNIIFLRWKKKAKISSFLLLPTHHPRKLKSLCHLVNIFGFFFAFHIHFPAFAFFTSSKWKGHKHTYLPS